MQAAKCDPAVRESVLMNTDLLKCILTNHVAVSTFVAARAVCKVWRVACSEDEGVLLSVARQAGCLIKRDFMGMLCLSSTEADAYQRERRVRVRGGHYYLYRADAFEKALGDLGGLVGWRVRKSHTSFIDKRWAMRHKASSRG